MIEVVYLGRRTGSKGALWSLISVERLKTVVAGADSFTERHPVEMTDRIEAAASLFEAKKKMIMRTVGAVYSVEGDLDGDKIISASLGSAKFVRALKANDDACQFVEAWRRLDGQEEERKRLLSAEKNADSDRWLTEAVKTIKHRYKAIPATSRRSFQLWLLNELDKK